MDEVRLEVPEEARETPGGSRHGDGLEPARRIDDRDRNPRGPHVVHVVAGAAHDPVLDRGRPMKRAHAIEEDLPGRSGRVDDVNDAKHRRHGFVEGRLKTGGASGGGGSDARAVSTGPPVQREHGPELLRTIGPSGRMLPVERLDGVATHAGQEAPSGVEDIPEEAPELGPEPLAHRRLEASLAPATDLRWEHVSERLAQDTLAAQRAYLPAPRDAERALDDLMIEELNPDLEGLCNSRDVDRSK